MPNIPEFRALMAALPEAMTFWKFPIAKGEIFYASPLSFAFTNLKPVIPGHVLVAPRRVVARMNELSSAEIADLFVTAEFVGRVMSAHYSESDALTFNVQDGKSAGQTVPHVHVHVIPRSPTDVFNVRQQNDAVYEAINSSEKFHVDHLPDITPRERSVMAEEAQTFVKTVERLLLE